MFTYRYVAWESIIYVDMLKRIFKEMIENNCKELHHNACDTNIKKEIAQQNKALYNKLLISLSVQKYYRELV